VVPSESRLEQKVPYNKLVLIPDQQKHYQSATYPSLIRVARNRLGNRHVKDQFVQTMAQ
jgi:hypothetical protein